MNGTKPTVYVLVAVLWVAAGIALAETFTGFYESQKSGSRLPHILADAAGKVARVPKVISASGTQTSAPSRRVRKFRRASDRAHLGLVAPRRIRLGGRFATDTEDFFPLRSAKRSSRVITVAQALMGRRDIATVGQFRIRFKLTGQP